LGGSGFSILVYKGRKSNCSKDGVETEKGFHLAFFRRTVYSEYINDRITFVKM